METVASVRGVRLSAQKGRLVADLVRGKPVDKALNILSFTQKKAAGIIKKAVESAIAQAVAEAAGSIRNAQTASLDEIELLFNQIAAAVEGKAGEAGGGQP